MNIIKLLLVLTFLLSSMSNSFAAKIPSCWLKSSECSNQNFIETDTHELDKTMDQIFEMKSNLVEKTGEKIDKNKKYYLASIKTELGIEVEGEIGVIESGGEAALELVWVRNLPKKKPLSNEKKFQNEFFGKDNSLDLTYANNILSIKPTILNLARNLYQKGKIKNPDLFTSTALSEINKVMGIRNLINQTPDRPWWPYKCQLELFFQAEGGLVQGPTVGGGFLLKLVWNRLEKKNQFTSTNMLSQVESKINQSNSELLAAMGEEFEEAYSSYQMISANDKTNYDFNNIKIGVGIGLEGNIFVSKAKGSAIASIFYKRDPMTNNVKGLTLKTNSFMSKINKTTLTKIPFVEQQNSLMVKGLSFNNIARDKFGFGLKKLMKAAHYFSKKAQQREEKLLRKGKIPAFNLDFMEIELELFASGDVGIANIKGISVMELFLSKRI